MNVSEKYATFFWLMLLAPCVTFTSCSLVLVYMQRRARLADRLASPSAFPSLAGACIGSVGAADGKRRDNV